MADKAIGSLTEATAIGATDEIHAVVGGNSRRVKGAYAGIASGTSFPGSPVSGMRFYRTDLQLPFFYDGTRWLSEQLFQVSIPYNSVTGLTASLATSYRAAVPDSGTYSIYVEKLILSYILVGTGNWTATFINGGTGTINTITVATAVSGNHYQASQAVNAVQSNFFDLTMSYTENSGSAEFFPMPAITYRLVGT